MQYNLIEFKQSGMFKNCNILQFELPLPFGLINY